MSAIVVVAEVAVGESSRAETAIMAKNAKKKAPTKAAKKRVAPKKPRPAAKKHAAPKAKKAAKTPAVPRPRTFAEKLRDANARLDDHGDDTKNAADGAEEADERDAGDDEAEDDADGTSEQE
jgi:hypothetical protein